jgi:hypothetical protein
MVRNYDTWPILLPQMTPGEDESVTPASNGWKPITSTVVTLVTLWLEREKLLETDHLNRGYPSYTMIREGEIHELVFQYLFHQFSSQFFFQLNFILFYFIFIFI